MQGQSGTAALGGFLNVAESFGDRCELIPLIKVNGGAGPTIASAVHRDLEERMLQALRAAAAYV